MFWGGVSSHLVHPSIFEYLLERHLSESGPLPPPIDHGADKGTVPVAHVRRHRLADRRAEPSDAGGRVIDSFESQIDESAPECPELEKNEL